VKVVVAARHEFASLVCGAKLGNVCPLHLERTTKGRSRGPVSEPFVEDRALALCDVASVNDACGSEFVANQETGEPVQCVMVVREDLADVLHVRIPVTRTVQDVKDVMPFHR
jgi:hypothetical protein